MYIYQLPKWPDFHWDKEKLSRLLAEVRYRQGKLTGRMESMGFGLQAEATLHTLTLDVLKSISRLDKLDTISCFHVRRCFIPH